MGQCLEKDPARRPTAAELLSTPFFRNAKKKSYLVGTVLSKNNFPTHKKPFWLTGNYLILSESLPPLTQRQERRKRASSTFHNTMDSWDFSNTLTRSLSVSRTGSPLPDEVPHTTDESVFELDEERTADKGQLQDDSGESSTGPLTPGPNTPVLAGLSSPPKDEATNRVLSVSPDDGPKARYINYNPPLPTAVPIPARITKVTHTRSASRSTPGSPTDENAAPAAIPHSAPPDKTSQGSKLWNKFTKRGTVRGGKLSAALDKTDTLYRVVSSGFSSRPRP